MKRTIILFVLLLFFLSGCEDGKRIKPRLPLGEKAEDIPSFVMEGFNLKSTEKGVVKLEVNARGAQIFESKKRSYAQEVTIKYYESEGKYSYLTADRAVIDNETNSMEITGNVRVNSSAGVVMETEKLFWDDRNKKMHSDERVRITRGGSVMTGRGFDTDAHLRNLKIRSDIELRARDIGNE